METGLKGKVVMVAASSRGLGYGVAYAAAKDGAKVSISSRTQGDIDLAAERIREETGAEVIAMVMDAAHPESIIAWRDATLEQFGRIDGLVVNAGGPPAGKFDDFSDDDWQNAFNLTLMSSVRMIRSVLPTMRKQGGGSIVTITSSSVKEPIDIILLSNVMRSGVTSLAKSLSLELAGENIRLNNLMPGRIDTDRVKSLDMISAEEKGISVEEQYAHVSSVIPMGRYGTIEEFGKMGAFLLSDAASYITGQTLAVDGGTMKTVW